MHDNELKTEGNEPRAKEERVGNKNQKEKKNIKQRQLSNSIKSAKFIWAIHHMPALNAYARENRASFSTRQILELTVLWQLYSQYTHYTDTSIRIYLMRTHLFAIESERDKHPHCIHHFIDGILCK